MGFQIIPQWFLGIPGKWGGDLKRMCLVIHAELGTDSRKVSTVGMDNEPCV